MSLEITLLFLLVFVSLTNGLHSLTGKVDAGNYTYYVLKYEGPIILELQTVDGDADLYVSDVLEHPTFELDEHSLSSWTCGIDTVFISKSFGRPINIGVYGHPRSSESRYILSAEFLPDDDSDPFINFDKEPLGNPESVSSDYEDDEDEGKEKTKFSSMLATTIYWLLEILIEILTAL